VNKLEELQNIPFDVVKEKEEEIKLRQKLDSFIKKGNTSGKFWKFWARKREDRSSKQITEERERLFREQLRVKEMELKFPKQIKKPLLKDLEKTIKQIYLLSEESKFYDENRKALVDEINKLHKYKFVKIRRYQDPSFVKEKEEQLTGEELRILRAAQIQKTKFEENKAFLERKQIFESFNESQLVVIKNVDRDRAVTLNDNDFLLTKEPYMPEQYIKNIKPTPLLKNKLEEVEKFEKEETSSIVGNFKKLDKPSLYWNPENFLEKNNKYPLFWKLNL
jgi:hypothetical protein